MSDLPLLSLIVFVPWAGAFLLTVLPRLGSTGARRLSLAFSLSTLVLAVPAMRGFGCETTGCQFVEQTPWIAALNVSYHLGLDGLSIILVLLTGLIAPASLLASWNDDRNPRVFAALFLFLQGSALGVFLALDFFLWFIFWELSLVPAFFLIKLWGGRDSTRAAYQFVIYTIGGSAFMLLGFAAIYAATGTMNFVELAGLASDGTLAETLAAFGGFWPTAIFVGVLLGLAVKVPLFPFHTWLPLAYAEAPTGASMFLTGVMSKMGVYGFFRILWPLFPEPLRAASDVLLWLALGGVVFGAFAAMAQKDLKRMVAYSSINHVSYCLLALFAVAGATDALANPGAAVSALNGAILQIFNHGISAAALFLFVGVLETRSGGLRGLNDFGGLRTVAPVFAGLCGIAMFSSLGLPGLNGFVGEFLIFRGVFGFAPWTAAVACIGLLVTAIFLLTFYQRVFHGPKGAIATTGFRDLSGLELTITIPAIILMFVVGIAPQVLVTFFNPLTTAWAAGLLSP